MIKDGKLWIAQGETDLFLLPNMANRHGLITGASGTGKTVTLKVMAEAFSDIGVPVFLQDIKGDVSGMLTPGADNENMQERIKRFGIENWSYKTYPTHFWDIYGEKGHPVRVTISDIGPTLISRLLGLTDVQESVLEMVFRIADDNGLLLIDLKDLRSMLNYVSEHKDEFSSSYGQINTVSVNTVLRNLLKLEDDGGNDFFGEPSLDITDWMRTESDGRGIINLLHSVKLSQNPLLYASFMLWMLSSVYEKLPEVGDLDKPRMIFFFDEAHMLFSNAPKALKDKIVQVIKLVRSKGVGVYFITQSPSDIPDDVLAQLSNRVQHALRAYTPAEQKAVKAAATAFRPNPAFKTEDAILELGTGEALVSFLDEGGAPCVVQRAFILPPQSFMGPSADDVIQKAVMSCEFELKYRNASDRESAFEVLNDVKAQEAEQAEAAAAQAQAEKEAAAAEKAAQKQAEKEAAAAQKAAEKEAAAMQKAAEKQAAAAAKKTEKVAGQILGNAGASIARSMTTQAINSALGGNKNSMLGKAIKSAASSASGTAGRNLAKSITRGILGNIK